MSNKELHIMSTDNKDKPVFENNVLNTIWIQGRHPLQYMNPYAVVGSMVEAYQQMLNYTYTTFQNRVEP